MKKSLLLILTMKMLLTVSAQKVGVEQYFSYTPTSREIEHSTFLFTQHRHNLITEIGYDRETENVLSLNAGRTFGFEKNKFSCIAKPTIGISLGSAIGINLNMDYEVEVNSFYFSSEFQYFFSLQNRSKNFLYAWLESGICFSEKFYGGISMQMNFANRTSGQVSKGFVFGFSSGRWNFPVYFFDPISCQKSITAGILYDINFYKRTREHFYY